eukprot:354122-Chlamydomonas_euryale.AAC.3
MAWNKAVVKRIGDRGSDEHGRLRRGAQRYGKKSMAMGGDGGSCGEHGRGGGRLQSLQRQQTRSEQSKNPPRPPPSAAVMQPAVAPLPLQRPWVKPGLLLPTQPTPPSPHVATRCHSAQALPAWQTSAWTTHASGVDVFSSAAAPANYRSTTRCLDRQQCHAAPGRTAALASPGLALPAP